MACSIEDIREILSEEFSGDALELKIEEYKAMRMAEQAIEDMEASIDLIGDKIDDAVKVGVEVEFSNGHKEVQKASRITKLGNKNFEMVYDLVKGSRVIEIDGITGMRIGGKSKYNLVDLAAKEAELASKTVTIAAPAKMYRLGSTYIESDAFSEGYYEDLGNKLVSDPEAAIEFAKELNAGDDVAVSAEQQERLLGVLGMLVGKGKNYIPDMYVYLNTLADENEGMIVFQDELDKRKGIYLNTSSGISTAANQMGAMEAYVHEIVHAATEYSLQTNRVEIADTVARLEKLQDVVMANITVEDLLPEHSSLSEVAEMDVAEQRLAHLRSKEGLSEFIALGLTNEQVAAKIAGTKVYGEVTKAQGMWGALKEWMQMLIDTAFQIKRGESRDTRGDELLVKLSLQLAAANNKAMQVHRDGIISVTGEYISNVNNFVQTMHSNFGDYMATKKFAPLRANPSKIDRMVWFSKNFWRVFVDPRMKPHLMNMLSVAGMSPEGTVQTLLRDFMDPDSLARQVERLVLASNAADKQREDRASHTTVNLLNGFKEKPTRAQDEAIKSVLLDIDISSLSDGTDYDLDEIVEMFSNPVALGKARKVLKGKIRHVHSEKDANFYVSQAEGLGRYMVTGIADPAQSLNAKNIARKLATNETVEMNEDTVKMIDRLATLEAIVLSKKDSKDLIVDLIKKDPDAIKNVLGHHDLFKKESQENLFADEYAVNSIKGYMRETFNQDITLKAAPLKDKKEMEKMGYEWVDNLTKGKGDASTEAMAMYINRDKVVESYNQGAMRLTDETRRGTTLTDIATMDGDLVAHRRAERNIRIARIEMERIIAEQEAGTYKRSETGNQLVPVFSDSGVIIDYRYMMAKDTKIKYLDMETRGSLALGRSRGSVVDKDQTIDFNKGVLDVIKKDMDENYEGRKYGKNQMEYVAISVDSPEKEIRELWKILPSNIKFEIAQRTEEGKEPLAVRRDLLYSYFGFRDATVTNAWGLDKVKAKRLKHLLKLTEQMWQSLIHIAKANIIIKMPQVLIANIMSNLLAPVQLGMSPWDSLSLQMKGVRELQAYQKAYKELVLLKDAKEVGNPFGLDISRIGILEGRIQGSTVSKLIDAGLFQSIVEEANAEDLDSHSKFTKMMDKGLEKAPKFVRNGANWLYLTERTTFYKKMTTATQYSDFVARYALYHGTEQKLKAAKDAVRSGKKAPGTFNGMRITKNTTNAQVEKHTLELVTDVFINYSIPNSKMIEYANKMGLVMFTKYFQRIQKVVARGVTNHPVNFLMALAAQEMVYDIPDVMEQSVFTKDMTYMLHNPLDQVSTVLTPPMFGLVSDTYKWFAR